LPDSLKTKNPANADGADFSVGKNQGEQKVDTILNNGATTKKDSRLPNTPTPVSGRVSADLEAEIAQLTEILRLKKQQRDAEATAAREAKRAAKAKATADEQYGVKCRVYRAFYAAREAGLEAIALEIANQFRTDSLDQQFTLKAMNDRRDAQRAADGEAARQKLAEIAAQ
jgi:hypothetical protein